MMAYLAVMPTVSEIRRRNLLALMHRYAHREGLAGPGADKAFAIAMDLNPKFLSQLKTGHRNMGTQIARKIEDKVGKPEGWMDRDQTDWSPEIVELATLLNRMTGDEQADAVADLKDHLLQRLVRNPRKP